MDFSKGAALLNKPLAQSGVAASITGTVNETTLATIVIPGGMMGPNGAIRVTAVWSHTDSANTKRLVVTFGGVTYQYASATNSASYQTQAVIRNRNSMASQVGVGSNVVGYAGTVTPIVTSSLDTSQDQILLIRGKPGAVGETVTLEGYTVEILPG